MFIFWITPPIPQKSSDKNAVGDMAMIFHLEWNKIKLMEAIMDLLKVSWFQKDFLLSSNSSKNEQNNSIIVLLGKAF